MTAPLCILDPDWRSIDTTIGVIPYPAEITIRGGCWRGFKQEQGRDRSEREGRSCSPVPPTTRPASAGRHAQGAETSALASRITNHQRQHKTVTMKDDRKQRKKSDRHRDDEKRRRRRDRDESDDVRKRTSRADDSSPSSRGKSRLTEEEERQYEKAQKYLKRKESGSSSRRDRDDSRDRRSHKHSRKDSRKEKKRDRDDPSEDDDMRHSKRDRKDDRHKRKKSSKRHRDEDDRDRKKKRQKANSFRDKARKVDSKLVSLGDVSGVPPTKLLNPEDDYFAYNSHLRLYLYQRHGVYFEDLTSDESHEAFREFARAYNDGKLEGAYYDKSLPDEALDQCKRTQHKWTFRTNKTEERNLDIVRAGVKKQTDYDGNEVEMARARMMQPRPGRPSA
ncbi:hypothetical protein THAOC_18525 [Thalassiosira oceanica]|uniref:Uncharacterized protein n=1 Tax=Thalassiosira oceanica TaxID=159749 RepID=K0S4I8_THAOC|nr:hypothetical protein THAOC_18525 [Thalassiosira oceanica]|eukprot:EJK61043.1 hypothetical protein THAOC_18525 [Thalassiosira oceanica]